MKYKVLRATDLVNAFSRASEWMKSRSDDSTYSWFRGVKDSKLKLQPGACWRSKYEEISPLVSFAQEGSAFATMGNLDDWTTYYLAQHHGIPTRLLDWTESFAAALFFALDGWDGTTTPCVWILLPELFNGLFLDWEGVISPENNPELNLWLPKPINKNTATKRTIDGYTYDNRLPLAIYPRRNNLRLVAQQGAFTVHGRKRDDIPTLIAQQKGDVSKLLARIDLVNLSPDGARQQLAMLGIRRSAIYPDINNFVLQLKEQYAW